MKENEVKVLELTIPVERQKQLAVLSEKFNPEGSKLRRYQRHLTNVLLEFDTVCKEHGIQYFLAYGTLLGAIRHKGYIPWDDDADLWMDRENYDKLEKLMHGECHELTDHLSVAMGIRPELWSHPFAYIDIFILDRRPDNKLIAKIKEWLVRFVYVMIKLRGRVGTKEWGHYKKMLPLLPIAMLHTKNIWMEKYKQLAQWCPFSKGTKLIQCYNETMSGLHRKYSRAVLDETMLTEFDGHLFPIPAKYDEVLRECYGDYMQIPDSNHIHVHGYDQYFENCINK